MRTLQGWRLWEPLEQPEVPEKGAQLSTKGLWKIGSYGPSYTSYKY